MEIKFYVFLTMKAMKGKSNIKMASHDAKTNSLNESAAGLDLQLLGPQCNQTMVGSNSINKFRLLQLFYDKKNVQNFRDFLETDASIKCMVVISVCGSPMATSSIALP
jgi:hypothetical protein